MTLIVKLKEKKDDGWYWDFEISMKESGILGRDEHFIERILMNVFHNADLLKEWEQAKTNDERRSVLRKSMWIELTAIRENAEHDVAKNIQIYPLPKVKLKKGDKK